MLGAFLIGSSILPEGVYRNHGCRIPKVHRSSRFNRQGAAVQLMLYRAAATLGSL
jgi:hypothetical protein